MQPEIVSSQFPCSVSVRLRELSVDFRRVPRLSFRVAFSSVGSFIFKLPLLPSFSVIIWFDF